jgi:hypothetical protein
MSLIGPSLLLSHPFRMRASFPMIPGISAPLQSLATLSNPSGVKSHHSMPLVVPMQRGSFSFLIDRLP